ncbi:MAG: acyltransferase [Verrucomicrobia bacterium]|nr:acyltransferase [Verrucomicrobiota bacterium]
MGWIRFLLAVAVVFHHSSALWGLPIVDGHQAVRLFYIISGFYMALILDRKYAATREGIWLFYSNRALRIFPVYWLVLGAAALFYGAAWIWMGNMPERLGWYRPLVEAGHGTFLAGLGVSQLALFGLDWFNCFDFQGSTLAWGGTVPDGRPAGFLCLVPQAWTLAVELSFYLFAPLLVRAKNGSLALLCAVGFAVRVGLWLWRPAETGSLGYFWFPLQLPFFALGILSYRWTGATRAFWNSLARVWGSRVLLLGLFLGYGLMPDGWDQAISCGLLAVLMPGLLEGEGKWQKWFGELSYPIYVVHILVKWVILATRGVEKTGQTEVSGFVLLAGSLLAAVILEKLVTTPLERKRQERSQGIRNKTPAGITSQPGGTGST